MKPLVVLMFLMFFVSAVFAQNNPDRITEIKKSVELIDHKRLSIRTISGSEEILGKNTDGNAVLIGYYDNDNLRKIILEVGLSSCKDVSLYFFEQGALIFVYEKEDGFVYDEEKNEFDHNKTQHLMDCRFYLDHDKIIKTLISGNARCTVTPTGKTAVDLINECSHYIALLNNKR